MLLLEFVKLLSKSRNATVQGVDGPSFDVRRVIIVNIRSPGFVAFVLVVDSRLVLRDKLLDKGMERPTNTIRMDHRFHDLLISQDLLTLRVFTEICRCDVVLPFGFVYFGEFSFLEIELML